MTATLRHPTPATDTLHRGHAPLTGWRLLDAEAPFRPGVLTALELADGAGSRLVYDLAARTLAAGPGIVWLDGGMGPDVYTLANALETAGADPVQGLARVRLARAFTAHQLQALVEGALPQEVTPGTGLVLAADLPDLYLDKDVPPNEARILLTRALSALSTLARRHDVAVVATRRCQTGPRDNPLVARLFREHAAREVRVRPTPEGLTAELPREGRVLTVQPARSRQRALPEYGLVMDPGVAHG